MEVQLFDIETQAFVLANIAKANRKDMPSKKQGWQFNWKDLFKTEGAEIYKLTLSTSPLVIEGLIMLTLMNGEMMYMNNIELAPHNLGENGRYDKSAGCLIAYGCKLSLEYGLGDYKGYLTFESKTQLIPLYKKKYRAIQAMGARMFIEPKVALQLIQSYIETHEE